MCAPDFHREAIKFVKPPLNLNHHSEHVVSPLRSPCMGCVYRMNLGRSGSPGWLASQETHSDLAGIIVLPCVCEQMGSDRQHFAHHRHQGRAFLETALNQSALVGAKGRSLQVNAAQGSQIEHLS
jgi:hypothetical protein